MSAANHLMIDKDVWTQENAIPPHHRALFICLACHMGQHPSQSPEHKWGWGQQIVIVGPDERARICKEMGWISQQSYFKGVNALCDCGAITKICSGVFEINPKYAMLWSSQDRGRKREIRQGTEGEVV